MKEREDMAGDEAFANKTKALFDDSVEGLDAATRSRLNRGRQAALAELGPARSAWAQWAPAAGVAAAAVVALVLWTGNRPPNEIAPAASATDFEILLNEDSLEMLEELEFYSWIELAEQIDESLQPVAHVG
jgi:hypothetical protein